MFFCYWTNETNMDLKIEEQWINRQWKYKNQLICKCWYTNGNTWWVDNLGLYRLHIFVNNQKIQDFNLNQLSMIIIQIG